MPDRYWGTDGNSLRPAEPSPAATPLIEVTQVSESPTAETCPRISQFLARLTDKWSVVIVVALTSKSQRVSELKRSLAGVSQRMLTHTLRNLERDGLVNRTVTPSIPPRVDYELTALGCALCNHVRALGGWVVTNLETIDAARSRYDREKTA